MEKRDSLPSFSTRPARPPLSLKTDTRSHRPAPRPKKHVHVAQNCNAERDGETNPLRVFRRRLVVFFFGSFFSELVVVAEVLGVRAAARAVSGRHNGRADVL